MHHARWVVDGKYWTASGVRAGLDIAFGWLGQLVGKEVAQQVGSCGCHRARARAQDDDEFAGAWTAEKQKALAEEVKDMF